MTDDLKPPVTSTSVGLIGVSDKDAFGYDHKADPLDLDALAEVAEGTEIRIETGRNPNATQVYIADDEKRMRALADGILALLAALKEAQADNARLTQLAEGRSKLGLLAVYMSDVMGDGDMVAARDDYLADAWDAGASANAENIARRMWEDGEPITNPYRSEAP